jgi:hypothetical protein
MYDQAWADAYDTNRDAVMLTAAERLTNKAPAFWAWPRSSATSGRAAATSGGAHRQDR